ncbi:MAG: hypothetical protein QG549_436 [Patescibacteria group bacterium]|nr:hypothetical protein [Patescibacteria group bacterium]
MRHVTFSLSRTIFRYEKVRFITVGVINTLVDFSILLSLSLLLNFPVFIANVLSTSCALAVSYLLNKKAVFDTDEKHTARQIILFVVVTLTGLWVLQTLIILGVSTLIKSYASGIDTALAVVIGKVIATVVSLTWNYIWYSRVVFKKEAV